MATKQKPKIDWHQVERDMRDSFLGRLRVLTEECAKAYKHYPKEYGVLSAKVRGQEISAIRNQFRQGD
jgi:hypothetical protein